MRVIGGKAKGQRLNSPKGMNVRPTSDRVREAIFSSIQSILSEATVIDLFAGAGTFGIEALSRYAATSYFVDRSAVHLQVVKENLVKTRLINQAKLICQEADAAIRQLSIENIKADVVFMDPPYGSNLISSTLAVLEQSNILTQESVVIVEFGKNEKAPPGMERLVQTKVKKYGSTFIAYYRLREDVS